MKLTKQRLKEIIKEEVLTERLKRWKVFVQGESKPLILMGKSERDVKQLAHMMIKNSSVKISRVVKEEKINEEAFSSREAKQIMDQSLREYAKVLRKAQHKIIKDWMSKAKAGVLDFFDIQRGLSGGDMSRAHQYETDFLRDVLRKDKIIDRFRSYFGGRKRKK